MNIVSFFYSFDDGIALNWHVINARSIKVFHLQNKKKKQILSYFNFIMISVLFPI